MEAAIVYPHQLFKHHPALKPGRIVYLVEEPLLITHNPSHRQRLLLHRLSMKAYEKRLIAHGYPVNYLEIQSLKDSRAVFKQLKKDGVAHLHIVETTDNYLEAAIATAAKDFSFSIDRYDSPLFLLTKDTAASHYLESKRFMATFYKKLRHEKNILMEHGKPVGGKYSFDADNRKRLPKDTILPPEINLFTNDDTTSAREWLATVNGEHYGEIHCWVPYTHQDAEKFLEEFLHVRFAHFGDYEDAIAHDAVRLWHSTLSPLLNIGLLTPKQVLKSALAYADEHKIPLNSLEGFIRQVLGWREFIRASYEVDGSTMRTTNFFKHRRPLSPDFWTANTGITPLDATISKALNYGYTHHIERLMVMGNFMLLQGTDPDQVYQWFMGMYVDAYDWVMVPNVYGMSQFADGGLFATKPYISGASYLKKMSDYKSGEWETLWTALYWNFIYRHQDFFRSNHRLSMMPHLLAKMDKQTRDTHITIAKKYLAK